MDTEVPRLRTFLAILLALSDILLAASLPVLFFAPSFGVMTLLALPAGFALARWQYGSEPWATRRRAAMTTLLFLAGLLILFVLLIGAGRTRPDDFEVGAAVMFLAVAWAGVSTYAIGLISPRAIWKPAASA